MKRLRKLGLIGGMGPESTIPYYHDIVYGVRDRLDNGDFPNIIIESVNVFNVLRLCSEEKYDELTDYLMCAINNLVSGGADFVAMSANTPHIVFDRLEKKSPVPIISIVQSSCDYAKSKGLKRLALFGTLFTMNGNFFKQPFLDNDIEILIPNNYEMDLINERISNELELGIVKESTLSEFTDIIHRMKDEQGIQSVILGCTELPLLLNDSVSPVPCLDTMKIHIDVIINEIMKD